MTFKGPFHPKLFYDSMKTAQNLLLNDYLRNLRRKIIPFSKICFYQILF